ncbi:alpha-hydroxy-acid oxidizing protein [Peptacetobacter sp.]|uniref:alpha-hydroxy-acid oxidizing protein n=1 Tax=Peptacetobacter sp. TaxID=2991975 RepID=UPI0026095AA7|nr:alpha-hydroxy-acid oxidizing protein [Peptacetobacter sp.]
MDMQEVRKIAKERMKGYCRVCAICDGKVCAGETPGMGGCGTGSAFHNNIKSLKNLHVNMRLVHDIRDPEISCNILGLELALPVMAAPIGGVSFNMGGALTEEEYVKAIVDGCKESGIIGCTGDGVPPLIHESGFKAISEANGYGIPFIKPWDSNEFDEKLEKAIQTKCSIVGMDIDAAGLITLAKMGRPVSPKGPEELGKIVEKVHNFGKKFILKGIMTVADARAAADAGCDAIVVSNHGGRVLDHAMGVADVLPEIAQRVKGHLTVLADGGVRDGVDILKMLALGADAVMIGRPFSIAAIGGEVEGVKAYIETLKGQLKSTMVLTGCPSVKETSMHLISVPKSSW